MRLATSTLVAATALLSLLPRSLAIPITSTNADPSENTLNSTLSETTLNSANEPTLPKNYKPRPGLPYPNHPRCEKLNMDFYQAFQIIAAGVEDVPKTCGDLWHHLGRTQPGCVALTHTLCDGEDGYLRWRFSGPAGCNSGAVAAGWWEATRNRFGRVDCEAAQPPVQKPV